MKEYIERTEELVLAVNAGARAIENNKRYHGTTYCIDVFAEKPREIPYLKAAEVLRSVDEIPAADVVERKRGEWIIPTKIGGRTFSIPHCSVCDGVPCGVDRNTKFCPPCGADMRPHQNILCDQTEEVDPCTE